MTSKAKIIIRGSALRIFRFFISIIAAFVLMPFIIHSLGDRMYGLWVVIGSFMGFYWLFDLGLGSAIQRYVSHALGSKNYEEANKVINTALFLFVGIGFIVLIFSFITTHFMPVLIKNSSDVATARFLIMILGCNFAINLPSRVFSGILTAHLRFDINTTIGIIMIIVRSICVYVLLKMGHGIFALAIITFLCGITSSSIVIACARHIAPYIKLSRSSIDKQRIKKLFSYSGITFIIQIADRLRFSIDNFVIAYFVGLSSVTVYSIASRLINYFIDFITSATGLMAPVFSQYEAQGDRQSIKEKFVLVTKICGYLSIFIGGTLIMFGHAFIARWMGKDYLFAYPLLLVLVIPTILALIQSPSIQLLYGISKHKFFAISNSIEGITNLILSIILVRKFGILGVALGTAIPMAVIKLFVQPAYVCRVIGISTYDYYTKTLLETIAKSSFALIIMWLMVSNFIKPNFLNLTFFAVVNFLIFFTFVFFEGLNTLERNYIRKILASKNINLKP